MGQELENYMKEEIEKGRNEGEIKGKEQMVVSLYKKDLLSKDVAIAELNVTDKEFEHLLSIY